MDDLTRAKYIADEAHAGQRYSDRPYSYHLEMVEEVLRDYGHTDKKLLTAAWLHDVIEDSNWTRDRLEEEFGPEVADIVWRVTDEKGKSRKERKQKTYPKIQESSDATCLKIADRIANIRECVENDADGYLEMYREEHPEFYETLYSGKFDKMWDELNDMIGYEH